ncbi:MAG TPA: FTR1 family protein [Solirubrobacteraceae bacterium]|nr:FTR1 family protein [Solirubrobacteraceae bacterium]
MPRRVLALLGLAALLLSQALAPVAYAGMPAPAGGAPRAPERERAGARALLSELPSEYRTIDRTHEAEGAARVRAMALALASQLGLWQAAQPQPQLAAAAKGAHELARDLEATADRLQPWPLPLSVRADAERIAAQLRSAGLGAALSAKPYDSIEALLGDARGATAPATASAYAAEAYALFATGPGKRLQGTNAALAASVQDAFWQREGRRADRGLLVALASGAGTGAVAHAATTANERVSSAATVLGDRTIGRSTVVADAAVIVFREGLEAVLILAAITASFVGERRRLRRPVLFGALLGLGATAATYALAQALVDALGDGGLRLQAITGLIAIAVLLVVTNWFFHRVYWSEWLGRFHRRRRAIERIDRFGFISGQLVAFTLLGLTSVYREGFETVLFLQNLQVSAGSSATALGIAIGLAGTLAVGFVTFKLERKLPYKKMLIATGVLIGLVLGVMVGTTVHSLQGLGWVPSTQTGFTLPLWCGQWLGLYATWEGIGAQLVALLVVYGSYAVARALQTRRYKRVPREVPTLARG